MCIWSKTSLFCFVEIQQEIELVMPHWRHCDSVKDVSSNSWNGNTMSTHTYIYIYIYIYILNCFFVDIIFVQSFYNIVQRINFYFCQSIIFIFIHCFNNHRVGQSQLWSIAYTTFDLESSSFGFLLLLFSYIIS